MYAGTGCYTSRSGWGRMPILSGHIWTVVRRTCHHRLDGACSEMVVPSVLSCLWRGARMAPALRWLSPRSWRTVQACLFLSERAYLVELDPSPFLPKVETDERSCGVARRVAKGEGGGHGRLPVLVFGPSKSSSLVLVN
jgi:hypothetical protein